MSKLERAKKLIIDAREANFKGDNPKYGMSILRLDKVLTEMSREEKESLEVWLKSGLLTKY